MKATRPGSPAISNANLPEAVVENWRKMGAPPVGQDELLAIQKALVEELSPARIARELAAAGAELRHPEVIECDARWRNNLIAKLMKDFAGLTRLGTGAPLRLKDADAAIAHLEALRVRLIAEEDETTLGDLRDLAIEARHSALSHAHNRSWSVVLREEQAEVSEWFRVWLETPELFAQWVNLRKASRNFQNKFADA